MTESVNPERFSPARALRPGALWGRGPWLDLSARLDGEADRLFLWLPVMFAIGIAVYFALPSEPSLALALALVAASCLAAGWFRAGRAGIVLSLAVLAASLGFLNAKLRMLHVAAPVVTAPTGVVEVTGRIVALDPDVGGSRRMVVDVSTFEGRAPEDAPARISARLRVDDGGAAAGDMVMVRAVLLPPPDASEPGGFNYARQAFFERIGAVGFLVAPPEVLARDEPPSPVRWLASRTERTRVAVSERIQARIGGEAGGIAAALVTGHRGGIPDDAQEALRASGLAHILAISGLHMMLVVGALFVCSRSLLALSQRLTLTRPIKKWAAIVALVGGAAYLVLSGGSIATQRAFIMATIMLVAVLFDRPAITLRNVAIAALIVLALTPEALLSASFQMSFAATVALVAGYEALRERRRLAPRESHRGVTGIVVAYLIGLMVTSLIAGLATAPYSAFHFNRVAVYGLAGNIAAMPLVGFIVMPAGLAAMCLMPLGLDGWLLVLMGLGIDAVLAIAHEVAAWPGAMHAIPAFTPGALALMTLGGLWLALWRSAWRRLGIAALAAGVALAAAPTPPTLLVARDLRVAALRGDDGRLIFMPSAGSGYVVDRWLRVAGDDRTDEDRPLTAGMRCDDVGCVAHSSALSVAYVRHPAAFEDCARVDVVIAALEPPKWCADVGTARLVIGPAEAERHGAIAVRAVGEALHIEAAAQSTGERPWNMREGGALPSPRE